MENLVETHRVMLDGEVIFTYIDADKIPDEYKKEFFDWMSFQTRPIIEDVPNAVYSWDWERWLAHKIHKNPLIFD